MIKNKITYGALLVIPVLIWACSVKKNTAASRAFHNLTSHYNILFNGVESYKKGIYNLQTNYKDDYTKILPIFLYHDKEQVSAITAEMDRAIKKATKLISMHSITAKPELKDENDVVAKQTEFYNKSEYNKWVDDAYLLMGKSHFYKYEFDKASETFQYIISNFKTENTFYDAKLWLSRISFEKQRMKEGKEIIASLEEDNLFPSRLKNELFTIKAHVALQEKDYDNCIKCLETVLEGKCTRFEKQRYNFIIAQIYQEKNDFVNSARHYTKVIKLHPPYEMTFNARINMALSYEAGEIPLKDIERQLQKMIKDDKNIDYRDQIYYAWGSLYFKDGNTDKAVDYYLKSASSSKGNSVQQAITYLSLADIFYEKPDYVRAQQYYDSTVRVIDADYPNYSIIFAKSTSLTNLVTQIQTVQLEDSVQKLSKMPEDELLTYIDDIIEAQKEADEEAKRLAEEKMMQDTTSGQQQFTTQSKSGSNWYFYNTTAINLGRKEFKKQWGTRKLEDNWRRQNKSSVISDELVSDADGNSKDKNSNGGPDKKAKPTDKYSREYYLVNIPRTDSAIAASNERIKAALFEMGNIYFKDLKDYKKAENTYVELLTRFPDYQNRLQVYYKLYSIGKITQDKSLMSNYQQKIINEYPNSNYTKILTDPDYFKKIEEEENKFKNHYASVYEAYNKGNFSQVAYDSRKAIEEHPESELVPYFEYMLVVSEGISKDTVSFIGDLKKYASKYPKSEITEQANQLISYLQNKNPEAAHKQVAVHAKEIYKINNIETHYVVFAVRKSANTNQLMFNIINFNIDNYEDADLKVTKANVDNKTLLTINQFKNSAEALKYYDKITAVEEIWKDVNKTGSEVFIISKSNDKTLRKENKLNPYVVFFKQHYKK